MRTPDRRSLFTLALLLMVLAVGATVAYRHAVVSSGRASVPDGSRTGILGKLQATTSTGRRGAYYLPPHYESGVLPLVVVLHGTAGNGSAMIVHLRALAERERFIAVAPDSVSVAGTWLVAQGAQGVTEDHRHVVDAIREVRALPDVHVDLANVLIAGFSVGGGAAAYIASHEDLFGAFAVLHGHVVLDGMGPRRVRGWLSTGDRDRLRTAESIRSLAEHLTRREAFPELETRMFRVDHRLQEDELAALIAWWLRRPPSRQDPRASFFESRSAPVHVRMPAADQQARKSRGVTPTAGFRL
jgi:dienelactone hydrolase